MNNRLAFFPPSVYVDRVGVGWVIAVLSLLSSYVLANGAAIEESPGSIGQGAR